MISEVLVFVSTIDVKSWLVMFGFQLSNIIPGFPRAKMYFVPPPYELSESQASENGQVSGGSCQEHEGLSPFPFANRTAWEPRVRGQRGDTGAGYKRCMNHGDFPGKPVSMLSPDWRSTHFFRTSIMTLIVVS